MAGAHRRYHHSLVQFFERCPRVLTAISVSYFAFLGLSIRVGIDLLLRRLTFGLTTSKSGALGDGSFRQCRLDSNAAGYFVQNILGCILMAVIARHKGSMNQHLATGLASGLCGSLTTWATWMGDEAITFMNGFVFEAFVSLICVLCVCLCSFRFGHFIAGCGMGDEPVCFDELCGLRGFARVLFGSARQTAPASGSHKDEEEGSETDGDTEDESGDDAERPAGRSSGSIPVGTATTEPDVDSLDWGLAVDETQKEDSRRMAEIAAEEGLPPPAGPIMLSPALQAFIVLTAFCLIILYIGLCAGLDYDLGLLDLAYSWVGALLRWYLSLYNAQYQKAFYGVPVFTLVANTLACVCNAFPAVLAQRETHYAGRIAIEAVSTGFAGCLSTVSTLISELQSDAIGGLRVRIFYFLISFGLAMAVELPILTAHC